MKHLEELEKELEDLLDNYIEELYADYSEVDDDGHKENLLKILLIKRNILQAYDAVEERKKELKNGESILVTFHGTCVLTADAIFKGIFPKELSFEYAKKVFCSTLNVSDYEWEWLKQQEGEDEG